MKTQFVFALTVVMVAALATPVHAAKGVAIGEAVPDFSMTDFAGKTHTLADYKGKTVVLSFLSHNCPYSRGTDPALSKVASDYAKKGVVFLGIDSDASNTVESVKKYATEKGLSFPIAKDVDNAYADIMGAARTPETYIIDGEGKLVFHGAYDDRTVPEQEGAKNYVKNALDEVLAGKAVSEPSVSAWGCAIKRVAKA